MKPSQLIDLALGKPADVERGEGIVAAAVETASRVSDDVVLEVDPHHEVPRSELDEDSAHPATDLEHASANPGSKLFELPPDVWRIDLVEGPISVEAGDDVLAFEN